MDFDKFCNEIMSIDTNIRFTGVLGRNGELIGGGHNVLSDKLLTPTESKMAFHYGAQRWDSFSNLSHKIGKEKYSITEYEKVKQISLPLDDKNLILISAETDADHNKIVKETLDLIERMRSEKG